METPMSGKRMLLTTNTTDRLFDTVNLLLLAAICFTMVYPIWYVVVLSFNNAQDAMQGGIYWWPRDFSLESYETVLKNQAVFKAYGITVARTVLATVLHVFVTAMTAYALTKKDLVGRKIVLGMGTFTMFFGGGLIPYFLVIKGIGLYDNFLVYILPALFSFFDLIIFQSFFRELPAEMEESAKMDGANELVIFIRIILPLSKPVLATIALFVGVGQWNDFFSGVIFIQNPDLQPIQTFLYRIISENTSNDMINNMPAGIRTTSVSSTSLKLATMVITTAPIVAVYPFLQKYFVKGLMIGSVKG
jgi:putative aldouronate transport system permease protein